MDPERSKFLPDVPTTTELGYPSVISNSSRAIVGPTGLDPAIVAKLQDAFLKAMNDPEHISKLESSGFTVRPMPADEFGAYFAKVNEETKTLVDLARQQ